MVMDGCIEEAPEQLLQATLGSLPGGLPPLTVLLNKCDLSGIPAGAVTDSDHPTFSVSARTGAGLPELFDHLKRSAGMVSGESSRFSARRRHLDALGRCRAAIDSALSACADVTSGELIAEDLRAAQSALGEITGALGSDELLGKIFASFCIGK